MRRPLFQITHGWSVTDGSVVGFQPHLQCHNYLYILAFLAFPSMACKQLLRSSVKFFSVSARSRISESFFHIVLHIRPLRKSNFDPFCCHNLLFLYKHESDRYYSKVKEIGWFLKVTYKTGKRQAPRCLKCNQYHHTEYIFTEQCKRRGLWELGEIKYARESLETANDEHRLTSLLKDAKN